MKKAHIKYLRRAINVAVTGRREVDINGLISLIKTPNTRIYSFIKEIVCDMRFYGVVENDAFWKDYAFVKIFEFLESLSAEIWKDEELLNDKKEDFLNDWFRTFCLPPSEERQTEMEGEINHYKFEGVGEGIINILEERAKFNDNEEPEDDDEDYLDDSLGGHFAHNCTQREPRNKGILPAILREYDMNCEKNACANNKGAVERRHQADAFFLSKIDTALLKLAKEIGRADSIEQSDEKGRFLHSRKSDISGVTVGDDLNSLLPSELAMLASPSTDSIFYHRFSQKRLQIFASASSSHHESKKNCGPIFISIDTSSSMRGSPEVMAKTLALAVAIIAQRTRRPVCFINYSYTASFFVLVNLTRQRSALLSFLSQSYSGGNDEDLMFRFLFKDLPKEKCFKPFAGKFENADLLVVSDYIWSSLDEKVIDMINDARSRGLRLYGLKIEDKMEGDNNLFTSFYETELSAGFDFFEACDFKYVYSNGTVKDET